MFTVMRNNQNTKRPWDFSYFNNDQVEKNMSKLITVDHGKHLFFCEKILKRSSTP